MAMINNQFFSSSTNLLFLSLCLLLFTCIATSQSCTSDEDCSPYMETLPYGAGVCNIITGTCTCNVTLPSGCFEVSNNTCITTACGTFNNITNECRVGTKSRTTALLLSIFLINFGAANFYIERYEFAIPQIIIGLLLCVFQFGSCAASCARDDKEKTSIPCILCCSVNSILSLTVFSWWIADLVIFATNSRMSGGNSVCPLY